VLTEILILPDDGALGAPKRVGLKTIILIEILSAQNVFYLN
jgi:hypothetical protein